MRDIERRGRRLAWLLGGLALVCVPVSCDLFSYGQLGGADQTATLRPGDPGFESLMSSLSGVWYSHYAGIGRLDGYRIGTWENFWTMVEEKGKLTLFPQMAFPYTYTMYPAGGAGPVPGDYFVLYDDTVYGQTDTGAGGNASWGFAYLGIVRAINIFNGDKNRGAIIIEYLKGCAPQWDDDIKEGQRPFFGIYYRILDKDTVQMANAVDLAALHAGEKYYTETKTLDEAIALNIVEYEAEFISWGVVIPQDREH
ncbi:MAG: hypothetical protein LBF95_03560 [Treponema sp.]|jgi:hypothetical protein|nr:hypothetical protein [Treponema sp.]